MYLVLKVLNRKSRIKQSSATTNVTGCNSVGNVSKNGKVLLAKIHEICGVSVQMPSVKIKYNQTGKW